MFRISLKNPRKSDVVIFDNYGGDFLEKTILEGIDHGTLHARHELFYVTPRILFLIFANMKHLEISLQKDMVVWRSLKKFLRNFVGNLHRIYLLSCIECMQPKVVITFIDNSYAFQFISRRHKGAYFLAVQNGIRCPGDLRDWLPPVPEPASIISMPVLCCFGDYEREVYKKYDHYVDEFYPVGSLKAGFYKTQIKTEQHEKQFDLCLVSQWSDNIMNGKHLPEVGIGLRKLDDYLKRYLKERKLKCCIALRSNDPDEEKYFIDQYGAHAHIIKSDRKTMSSYRAIDQSSVVVTLDSTLGREAFGWGAKVLFCNLAGDEMYTFPCPGFWSMAESDYALFRDRLDYILSLDNEEYRRQTRESAAYVMHYDPKNPPHEFIRGLILKQLGD